MVDEGVVTHHLNENLFVISVTNIDVWIPIVLEVVRSQYIDERWFNVSDNVAKPTNNALKGKMTPVGPCNRLGLVV
jgi:hypothetical protein